MAVTLSDVRTQVYDLLKESSGDSNVDPTVLNRLINQSVNLVAPIIELPRKTSTGTAVTAGMGDITLPTDNLLILSVFYGDTSVSNGVKRLMVVTEETMGNLAQSWLDTATASRGIPRYFFKRTETTGTIFPRAQSDQTSNSVFFTYVYNPASLSADGDNLPFPDPYNNIVKFYALYLVYLSLSNPALAEKFRQDFLAHHKLIQSGATKETREGQQFTWSSDEINRDDADTINFN